MRPRGKYAHPDEIKFRDRKPEDGQEIGYRMHGCKGYYRGTYNASKDCLIIEVNGETREHSIRYLMGWMPLKAKRA